MNIINENKEKSSILIESFLQKICIISFTNVH